jgi:CRISPR-associated endonuclease/helicase Cas3
LRDAENGILQVVAEQLRILGGTDEPLEIATLRGGMPQEKAWASSPAQPTIVLSTVDQVGSRLLFRGYGVTAEMAPIHAGLVAEDSLIILDEAHLSAPFRDTLEAVQLFCGEGWRKRTIVPALEVVSMSATLGDPAHFQFRETYEQNERPSEVLRNRLHAHKLAVLVPPVETGKGPSETAPKFEHRKWRAQEPERRAKLAAEIATQALELLGVEGVRVVGVVVNRVSTARDAFGKLAALRAQGRHNAELLLLTGRCRPFDRDSLLARFLSRIRAGRIRVDGDHSLIVIATQCIEAGADIDFDALVTEIASLDALRQRFGRLDRMGELGMTQARIVGRSDQIDRHASADAVYGEALKNTWKYLARKATAIDFGIEHFTLPDQSTLGPLLTERRSAPVLLPGHLDLFCQTSPKPHPDPDPAIFLHGPSAGPADVSIVWRADLPYDRPGDWKDIVSLLPPSSAEAMPVPFAAAKGWLAERAGDSDFADVEGTAAQSNEFRGAELRALLWLGSDEKGTRPVIPEELFPGCTIIVPSNYGGADEFGWEPDCETIVPDLGDLAFSRQRGRAALRLHEGVFESWIAPTVFQNDIGIHELQARLRGLQPAELDGEGTEQESMAQRAIAILRVLASTGCLGEDRCILATQLVDGAAPFIRTHPSGAGLLVIGPPQPRPILMFAEGDASSRGASNPISLTNHTQHVIDQVKRFANLCRVADETIRSDLELTAMLHDIGKCDRRFQALLYRDRVAAAGGPVLAKSGTRLTTTRERERERKIAGVPDGWRHELLTLSLLTDNQNGGRLLNGAAHRELILHLIATHHGYCRAIAPLIDDRDPPPATLSWEGAILRTDNRRNWARLDSGITDRFWELTREFGWFGLAYLEALLRLADHRASAFERINLIAT